MKYNNRNIFRLLSYRLTNTIIMPVKRLSMDSNNFYGRKRMKLDHIENKYRYFCDNPIPEINQGSILGYTDRWEVFHYQTEAIDFCRKTGDDLMVFSNEIEKGKGRRNFIVSHPKFYWKTIMQRPVKKRSGYEVIVESNPSKLYFDLEFSRICNKTANGTTLTNTFIKIVNYYLNKEFHLTCDDSDVLNLDSCSATKFSKHLIYDKVIFQNNIHAGNFVKHVCREIERLIDSQTDLEQLKYSDLEQLLINNSTGKRILFCDQAVYTRNRNFRLFKCTKLGKQTTLEIAPENSLVPIPHSDEGFFFASLITHVKQSSMRLTFESTNTPFISNNKNSSKLITGGYSESPYTEIDTYIESQIGSGSIRSWKYFDSTSTLLYEINNYRYCHNIGREHKSNGIMFVVNLRSGVYYQKCHDPDCAGFKSEPLPLPLNTMPWMAFDDISEEIDLKK